MKRALLILLLLTGLAAATVPARAATVGAPDLDLVLTKAVSADGAFPGDPLSYTLDVVNLGPSGARLVQVTDNLPAEVTFVGAFVTVPASPGPTTGCTHDGSATGGVVTCDLGNMNAAGSGPNTAQIRIDVVAAHTATAVCTNTATVRSSYVNPAGVLEVLVDRDPTNDAATTTHQCLTPSITVVKQASPEDGTTFAFTGDLGPFDLTVPAQPSRTFDNLAPGLYAVTELVPPSWRLGALACSDGSIVDLAGATATVDLAANEAVTCTFSNEPQRGSITVVKQATPADWTTFTFTSDLGAFSLEGGASQTFNNLAPGTYTVTEAIPAGWVLSELTCDDGSSTDLTTATATVELAAGENVTCTFSNEGFTPDVKVTINDNQDPVPAGKEFWYYVNVTNLGEGTASGVMVELLFIDGRAQLMNAASNAFGCDATVRPSGPNLVLLEINDLRRACRISVPVVAGAAGLYKSEVRVIQGGGDPSNDHDVEFTRVVAPLQLTQTVEPGPVVPVGTRVTFVIRVTNVTAAGITNVRLFDQLPPGLTYVSDDGGGAYVAPNWHVGTLAAGTSATLRIVASVDAPGEFTNTVAVAAADGVSDFPPPVSVVVDAVAAVSVLAATTAVAGADILPATGLTLQSWLLLGLALIGSGTAMVVRVNRSRVRGRYG